MIHHKCSSPPPQSMTRLAQHRNGTALKCCEGAHILYIKWQNVLNFPAHVHARVRTCTHALITHPPHRSQEKANDRITMTEKGKGYAILSPERSTVRTSLLGSHRSSESGSLRLLSVVPWVSGQCGKGGNPRPGGCATCRSGFRSLTTLDSSLRYISRHTHAHGAH